MLIYDLPEKKYFTSSDNVLAHNDFMMKEYSEQQYKKLYKDSLKKNQVPCIQCHCDGLGSCNHAPLTSVPCEHYPGSMCACCLYILNHGLPVNTNVQ
jgi:hypothetical protein